MTRPHLTYPEFLAARALARRLFVSLAEAVDLLGYSEAGRRQDARLMLARFASAEVCASVIRSARHRARCTPLPTAST